MESLLFVAPSPIQVSRLAQVLGVAEESVETALTQLADGYVQGDRGLRVLRKGDRVHLTTAPQAAPHIERFLGLDLSTKLSQAALEALAVIAYRLAFNPRRDRSDPRVGPRRRPPHPHQPRVG